LCTPRSPQLAASSFCTTIIIIHHRQFKLKGEAKPLRNLSPNSLNSCNIYGTLAQGESWFAESWTLMPNTPHHHKQVLTNHAQEDAALKRWEDDDRWIAWIIKNFAGALRRLGK
jgi:hypothetical protein